MELSFRRDCVSSAVLPFQSRINHTRSITRIYFFIQWRRIDRHKHLQRRPYDHFQQVATVNRAIGYGEIYVRVCHRFAIHYGYIAYQEVTSEGSLMGMTLNIFRLES